jgi:hypothetical protein
MNSFGAIGLAQVFLGLSDRSPLTELRALG